MPIQAEVFITDKITPSFLNSVTPFTSYNTTYELYNFNNPSEDSFLATNVFGIWEGHKRLLKT